MRVLMKLSVFVSSLRNRSLLMTSEELEREKNHFHRVLSCGCVVMEAGDEIG